MHVTFNDEELEDWFLTGAARKGKYKKLAKDRKFTNAMGRVIQILMVAVRRVSFLHYERLRGNLTGTSSVRILNGRVERLLFTENESGIEIIILEIDTTHYGKKYQHKAQDKQDPRLSGECAERRAG